MALAELTFIVLARDPANTTTDVGTLPMIGDVNLFLKGLPTEADFEAELEVMIAGVLRFPGVSRPVRVLPDPADLSRAIRTSIPPTRARARRTYANDRVRHQPSLARPAART